MRLRWIPLVLLAISPLLLLTSCGENRSGFIPPEGTYDARILRDNWGVPHVFGKTDADAAYGLAWAQCEDDWVNVEDGILLAHAKMASVRGKEFAKFDYVVQLFKVRAFVEAKYESEISADVRAVIDAYADGINHFAALHPDKMPDIPLPVTGVDIVCNATLKAPFFYDLQRYLTPLFEEDGKLVTKRGVVTSLIPEENPFTNGTAIGSNAWAIAPKRSADGFTRLAVNSHQPWTGPVAWYEAHLKSDEGWNMIGGTFPMGPMIFKGHDEIKGWCHTINRPDLCDVYKLDMNPENANQYRYDGEWRDLEQAMAPIKVKLLGPISWTFKRELLWSEHGPAIRKGDEVFALRFAGYGEVGHLEQWYRMNKAQNMDEFLTAMKTQGLVSLNTVYADHEGNIFYAYNGHFPKRKAGEDWQGTLPGDTSELVWSEHYTFDDVPQIINPASGFVQSCNNTPFGSTDGPDNPGVLDFPKAMGIETFMTNRALRALETYGADPEITREEFYAYKYDKTYSGHSDMAELLSLVQQADIPETPLYQEGLQLLRDWDRQASQESTGAALAILAGEPYMEYKRWDGEPVDPGKAFMAACDYLQQHHGRLDIPWGELMRLRRGDLDLPLGGGPDLLRALDIQETEDHHLMAVNGDCFYQMVEWDTEGKVHSESIHQFGAASTDPESPHYDDQAPLFAREEMRPTLLDEADIRANLAREYRPGEITGAWYQK